MDEVELIPETCISHIQTLNQCFLDIFEPFGLPQTNRPQRYESVSISIKKGKKNLNKIRAGLILCKRNTYVMLFYPFQLV